MSADDPRDSPGTIHTAIEDLPSLVLLDRMRLGELAARDELLRRYWPRLARWARGRLPAGARDLYDTTDLVQETVVRVFGRLDEFEPRHEGALLAYLRTAVKNRIHTLARQAERRGERLEPDSKLEAEEPSPLELVIGRDAIERYERALDRLGPGDRHAILVRIELDLPYEEIARELGKPSITAARMAVSRAIYRLASEMQREASV